MRNAFGRAPWLRGRYPASTLLRAHPPGSRLHRALPPRLARLPCFRGLSPRGEEPFPVSNPWPCARAAALYSAGRVSRRSISEPPAAFAIIGTARRPGVLDLRSLNRAFTRRCGPRTRSPRQTGLSRWASLEGISPPSAIQAMRLRPIAASGLSPYGPMGTSRRHPISSTGEAG